MTFSTFQTRIRYSFVHESPVWIDIPMFFKYIKGQSKGFVYSTMRDVLRIINDDWVITYHRNTGVEYMRLYSFMKTLGLKHTMPKIDKDARYTKFRNSGCSRHARAQAMDDVFTFPKRVSQAVDSIRTAVPNIVDATTHVTTAASSIQQVALTADSMLQKVIEMVNAIQLQMNNMITTLSDNIKEILMYLIKLVALSYLLQQDSNQSINNVIALLTLIMPSSVMSCVQSFATGLIRVIQRISGCNAQEEGESDCGFVLSFFNLTVGIVKGLFGHVPRDVYDNLFISSKKIRLLADYIKGTTTIVDCVLKLWEKCIEIIGDKILKYFKILPTFIREDSIIPLVDEFLLIKQERHDMTATTNQESARRVVALHDKLIKLEALLIKQLAHSKNHVKILPYIRIMIKSLDTVIVRIPEHLRTGLAPRRIKPFWVYIYGDPRIGKTGVFQPYIVNAVAQALNLNSKYEDYTNYTYLRNCGEDYWEGYDNHPVLWYNDIFQNFADEPAMHKAIMELTNIVDDNVYPLEMAFERKHNVYFNSQLVISNAQNEMISMPFIANKCWSGGSHLYARRNICVHFSVNEKYRGPVGIDFNKQQREMDLNPANCVGYEYCTEHTAEEYRKKLLFPKDLYILNFTDPLSGNGIGVMTFADGINYICNAARDYKTKQSDFKDRLYSHFEERWKAQAQEDDEFTDAREMTDQELEMYIQACSQSVTNNMRQVIRDLIGTEDMDVVYHTRRNADGGFDIIHTIYAGNTYGDQDAFVRTTYVVETIGAEYWMTRKHGWWQKFKIRCQTLVDHCKKYWEDIMMKVFTTTHLKVFAQFIQWSIMGYTYYRIIRLYYDWIHTLFAKKKENIPHNQIIAQTAEGKQKPRTAQAIRIKKNKQNNPIAMSYDQQNSIVENIISKQMCKFSIVVKHDGEEVHSRMFGSGLCLGSDVFVIPYHFWFRFKEMQAYWEAHGDTVILRLFWNERLSVDLNWDSITTCRLDYKHCEDLIYIRINKLVQKSHIKQFFIRSDDRPTLFELYMYGMRAGNFVLNCVPVQNGEYVDTVYNHESRDDPLYGGKFEKREVVIPICLKYYNCLSNVGDCGMMVLNCDNKMNNRKIMAMHTAGHVGENYGLGSLIFYEDIEEAFSLLYAGETPITAVAMAYEDPPEYAQPLKDIGLQVLGKLPRLTVPEYKVDKYPVVMLPRKSKIQKSVVHDLMVEDFGPTTLGIARLRPFDNEQGERVYPMLKALTKIAVVSNSCDDWEIDIIQDHIAETISSWKSPYEPVILTDDQMINGVGNLNAMEMSTSAGYPYVFLDNTNGKQPFFIKSESLPVTYTMGDYLATKFKQREFEAMQGIITDTYFIDTLKDETRELSKVYLGKTRLFQIAPVDFNMLIRKYFGAFLMHAQATYIRGEGAVGINANSLEWTAMVEHQLAVGDDFLNGDGENFDASAAQRLGMSNVESINKWYRLGKDWKLQDDVVRRVLFATFLNSKHIYRDIVYIAVQGNKSGTAITTWFNNLIGMFVIRLAILRLYKTLLNFHRGVAPKFYGDDDTIAVNRHVYPLLTCRNYQKIMLSVGIKYTSASKGDVVETWYKLDEITFLKRRFQHDGVKYLPQLDWQVIIEISRWSESDPLNMVDQLNRFNSALLEASNYGRAQFQSLRIKFVEYCYLLVRAGHTISVSELFIFEYCERIKWGEDYTPNKLHYDRAKLIDNELVVRSVRCGSSVQLSHSPDNSDQNSGVLQLIAQSQTYEGKSKPSRPQVIRINRPKAQGEEEDEEFNAYMVVMEYMKQMQPCIETFSKALLRVVRKPNVRWTFAVLYTKLQMMMAIYNDCLQLVSNMPAQAQGEEIAPTPSKNEGSGAQPSSTEVKHTDGTAQDSIQQTGKTTVVDYNAPHQPPVQYTAISRIPNCNFAHVQEDYFKRPIAFDTFIWKTTDKLYSKLGEWVLPYHYYNEYTRAKGAMIAFARPSMEIMVTINATRFHYGRILFVVYPFGLTMSGDPPKVTEALPEAYLAAQNATTWPHWYQVSAGPRQSIKFVVPYRNIYNQVNLGEKGLGASQLFGMRAFVMAPLQTANSTAAPVEVTLFGSMINPEFAGTILSSAIAQGEEHTLSAQGVVTRDPIGNLRGGKLTQTFDAVSAATKDVANFAYVAGFSNAVNTGSTGSMQIRQPLMNKSTDLPNSVMLGPTQDASVIKSFDAVNSETDDMNINHIVSSPSLVRTHKMTSASTAGTTLFAVYLNPRYQVYGGEGYVPVSGTQYPTPMAYIARMFDLWRGSFKIHFSAICSGFHSARLRIVYIPGSYKEPDDTLPTDLWKASVARNVIWDINDTADITIEVPFETITQWCNSDTDGKSDFSGAVYVQVINPLTSIADIVNPIYIQTFVSGCDDFQFSRYNSNNESYIPDLTVTAAMAQGEERDPCSIPASSATCLREQRGIFMGDVDRRTRMMRENISSVYTSVKQLCNQLTFIDRFNSTVADKNLITCRIYSPYGNGWTEREYDDNFWNAPLHKLIPIFRFMRGGFRVHVLANDKLQATAWSRDVLAKVYSAPTTPDSLDFMNGTLPLKNTNFGCAYFHDTTVFPIDFTVPYYSTTPCELTLNNFGQTVPTAVVCISTQKTDKTMLFAVSAGDDFMLGYRMGIPRCRFGPKPAMLTSSIPREPEITPTGYVVDIEGKEQFRYDSVSQTFHPVKVDNKEVQYFYKVIPSVGTVWVGPDNKYPSSIDGNTLLQLVKFRAEKILPKTRPKRSLFEKITGGQLTDFSSESE